ncbi:alpha/beta fold hydrolase [Isoalcanivorax beigongshangi]|uniref:Alpha/beta fold hydrolase n=1 Tax=Isoalcanivorax beigongshangi TaxID=3238810 RepID=A0ABV4AGL7_9GAMM
MSTLSRARTGWRALSHAVERRRHPERFILVDRTPWQEIYRDDIMAVRHYRLPEQGPGLTAADRDGEARIPLLLIPALGIQTWTFDIMPSRSMVRYLLARGFDVYVLDWGRPSQSQRSLSLDVYVNQWLPAAVQAVRGHSGADQVSLLGYCMGGLLAMMYLAAHPAAPVAHLITIASPVNFHQSGAYGRFFALMSRPALKAHEWFRLRLKPVDERLFEIPARLLSLGFKMTNPPGVLASYLDLVRNVTDRDYITEYMTMGQWFNNMLDYPGATVREVIEKMIISNHIAGGTIVIGGRLADLSQIRCPLLALAGASDKLVTIRAARDILRVSGSHDKQFMVVPGGHAGVFAGSQAPDTTWRLAADWLLERD